MQPLTLKPVKITTITLITLTLITIIYFTFFHNPTQPSPYTSCNIIGIELRGELYTYIPQDRDNIPLKGLEDITTSEDILQILGEAKTRPNIKAVLIEVDSTGGSPAAAEEIDNAIKTLNKPVIAFIRESGLSAAYYSISHADQIFALNNSNIGAIGVTQSYLDNVSKNQKEGLSFIQLSTGKYKDSGNPDKKITADERKLFMRDLEIVHNNFIKTVSEGRKIDINIVKNMADGSTILGQQALEMKLIDQIGTYNDTLKYVENKIGEKVDVCW